MMSLQQVWKSQKIFNQAKRRILNSIEIFADFQLLKQNLSIIFEWKLAHVIFGIKMQFSSYVHYQHSKNLAFYPTTLSLYLIQWNTPHGTINKILCKPRPAKSRKEEEASDRKSSEII